MGTTGFRRENAITRQIIGAAIEVHRALGPGLLESVYETCLEYELLQRQLQVTRQHPLPIVYREIRLDGGLRLDLFVEDLVIVELKAVERIEPIFRAQILSYLKLANCRVGLLLRLCFFRRCRCRLRGRRIRAGPAPLAGRWRRGRTSVSELRRLRKRRNCLRPLRLLGPQHRQLIRPFHSRQDWQDNPVFSNRPAFCLRRKPIGRRGVSRSNPLLPENVNARSFVASGTIRQRHKPHRLPEPVRFQVLRTPAAIQLAAVCRLLEHFA